MLPDRFSSTFKTAAQGLAVQRERLAVASRNIANANTSAPVGSANVYRPQSVKTLAPDPNNFRKLLEDSVSSLRRTDPRHLSGTAEQASFGPEGPQNMGPDFEVAESDNFRYEYDPSHPDADENGMVRYPDIDLVKEMTQMVSANRLYEANLSAIEAEKEIIKKSLQI